MTTKLGNLSYRKYKNLKVEEFNIEFPASLSQAVSKTTPKAPDLLVLKPCVIFSPGVDWTSQLTCNKQM